MIVVELFRAMLEALPTDVLTFYAWRIGVVLGFALVTFIFSRL